MKKFSHILGFSALAWAMWIPNSDAYHDSESGWMDLHGTCEKPWSIDGDEAWTDRYSQWPSSTWDSKINWENKWSEFYSAICGGAGLGKLRLQGTKRGIMVRIKNDLADRKLVNEDHYLFSGYVGGRGGGSLLSDNINRQSDGFGIFVSSLEVFASRGTVGVLSYQIEGLNDRLAIMWSVPYDRISNNNRFNVKIVKNNGTSIDKSLYRSMNHKEYRKKGRDDGGYFKFDQRGFNQQGIVLNYCIAATMGKHSYPMLDVHIREC